MGPIGSIGRIIFPRSSWPKVHPTNTAKAVNSRVLIVRNLKHEGKRHRVNKNFSKLIKNIKIKITDIFNH